MFFLLSAIAQLFLFGSMTLMAVCVVFILLIYRFHHNQARLMVEKKQLEFYVHEQILKAQLEIQEETLKNISMEIHDNIGQTLSLAKLNLNRMQQGNQSSVQKISDTGELVGKAIQDLRSLSRILHTDTIQGMGLIEAVRFQIEQLQRSGAFKTGITVTGTPLKIDGQTELILFRVIQESINNAIRHSKGNAIHIRMDYQEGSLFFSISDNGKGFIYQGDAGEMRSGSGLRNMRNRVKLIKGEFNVVSGDSGTIINITIPYK
jgi:signal transduction histidine kinase